MAPLNLLSKFISIPLDKEGRIKGVGYAFCEFESLELAQSAIRNLDKTELKKRIVRVNQTSKRDNANEN